MKKILISFLFLTSCVTTKEKEDRVLTQDEVVSYVQDECKGEKDELTSKFCQMGAVINYCVNHPLNRTEICKMAIKTCYLISEDVDQCLPGKDDPHGFIKKDKVFVRPIQESPSI